MANLYRLISAALLMVVALSASALPVPLQFKTAYTDWMSSATAACAASIPFFFSSPGDWTVERTNGNPPNQCQFKGSGGSAGSTMYLDLMSSSGSCPANSTQQGSSCVCEAGFEEKDGQCRPVNPCPEGQVEQGGACVPRDCEPDEIRVNGVCVKEPPCPPGETRVNGVCKKNGCEPGKDVGFRLTNGENTTYSCEEGCTIKTNASMCVTYDGVRECGGTGRMTGSTCKPGDGSGGDEGPGDGEPGDGEPGDGEPGDGEPGGGDSEPPTLPPDLQPPAPVPPDPDTGKCPAGTQRYSNGNCYPPTPDPTPPDTDGKCPPGTVKVRTVCVSPSPPGKPVPDTGTPENPNPGGGDGDGDGDGESGFGGSCMSGFACEGDAIFCAIAKEQHRRACKLFDDKSAESDLYDEAKAKTGDQTKDNPLNETINIAGRINQTDALGGGACIGDLNITVWGTSVNLPLAKLCPTLAMLGNLLVAVSMLVALRIITRG